LPQSTFYFSSVRTRSQTVARIAILPHSRLVISDIACHETRVTSTCSLVTAISHHYSY